MTLWTSDEIVASTNGTCTGNWSVSGVSIDTRSIEVGDLFVALKDVRDGHDFVQAALDKGAAGALVERVPVGVTATEKLIIVEDVLGALTQMAAAARQRMSGKVVAVTGSVGKTSTKEMLRVALAHCGRVHAAERSFNNHWGVPLTLARMPAETDFAIIEIGMNHAGEITPLSLLAKPDVALITTVAPAHMAAFASVDEIALAKAEVFAGLHQDGVAIVHRDIVTFSILKDAFQGQPRNLVTFGVHQRSDWQILNMSISDQTTTVAARHNGVDFGYRLSAPGAHFATNALGVLAVVDALGQDIERAAIALVDWQPPAGRGVWHQVYLDNNVTDAKLDLIDDAYNANPTSLAASIAVLAASSPDKNGDTTGRRIAIVGDMLELGEDEVTIHQAVSQYDGMAEVDVVHCAGPLMRHLHECLHPDQRGLWFATAHELAQNIGKSVSVGDVVLVKGSLGSKISIVVDAIKKLGQGR
jgi:UDP-N-acetylmuramoyl-tripeptide--D-alanyl-D-alanine ligase